MPEELKPDGLSYVAAQDPATLAAWAEAEALKGKEVVDVNGARLGKVTRCFAEEGALTRCDVTLTNAAKRMFHAQTDVAGIPSLWIVKVEGDEVRLRKAAEEILHPNDPGAPRGGDEKNLGGAPELPRKNR